MDTAQLSAWFQANKTEVLMAGGAAVAGLALYNKRKTKTGGPTAGVTAGAVAPGTMPAGAVAPTSSYDSSSFDAYNALQDEIGSLAEEARQTGAGGSGVSAAVGKPVASTLFAPSSSSNFVRFNNTDVAQVQDDGSLYHLTASEWAPLATAGARYNDTGIQAAPAQEWSAVGNLGAKYPAGDPSQP